MRGRLPRGCCICSIIVVPSWWKVFWLLNRFFPSFGIVLAEKAFLRI